MGQRLHDELLQLTLFKLTVPWELQQTFTMVSTILRSPEAVPRFTTRALCFVPWGAARRHR